MKRLMIIFSFALMLLPASLFGQARNSGYTLPDEPKRAKYIDFPSLDQGFWFAAQVTPATFFKEGFSVRGEFVAGYRFGEFVRVGAGVSPGIIYNIFYMPIFLDVRGNIISQESRMAVPYWNVDLGYSISQVYKGFYASPTLGVRVGMPRNNFIAGLTYIAQFVPGSICHGLGIKLGFEF